MLEKMSKYVLDKILEFEADRVRQQENLFKKCQEMLDAKQPFVNVNCSPRRDVYLDRINVDVPLERVNQEFLPISKFLRSMWH